MNNIQRVIEKLHKVEDKFGVDARDLELLSFISSFWDKKESVRVMDIVRTNTIASPTTILNLLKDLEFVGVILLVTNADDAREKMIVKSSKFVALEKFLGGI